MVSYFAAGFLFALFGASLVIGVILDVFKRRIAYEKRCVQSAEDALKLEQESLKNWQDAYFKLKAAYIQVNDLYRTKLNKEKLVG